MANFLERLSRPGPVIGCFAFLPSPEVVEIIALSDFDFVIIDREHSPKDWSCVTNMVRAAEARGLPVLVRVSRNDRIEILQALESGADGIVVPRVMSADDAASAVEAMKYPPDGARGACPQARGSSYGAVNYPEFMKTSNKSRSLLLLIESAEAVAQIEEIAARVGPNALLMLGRSDLAAAMGEPGGATAPAVVDAANKFIGRVHAAQPGSTIGMGLYSPAEAVYWYSRGCKFFWHGADISIFMHACKSIAEQIRRETASVRLP